MGARKYQHNPNYKCTFCGKMFFRYPSTVRNEKEVFCCRQCHYNYMKISMKGENNPNFGNKWSGELKQKVSEMVKERYIQNPSLKELCASNKGKKFPEISRKLKEYYKTHPVNMKGKTHSEYSKKIIGEKSKQKFTIEYRERMRAQYEKIGLWIPLERKESIKIYYEESNWKQSMFNLIDDSLQIKKLNEYGVFNCRTNQKGVVRDHMYSRRSGYENGVFPEILRHPCNCQILTHSENIKKKKYQYIDKNDLTLDELFNRIISYKKEWYEQKLVLRLIEDYKNGKRWFNKYRKEN